MDISNHMEKKLRAATLALLVMWAVLVLLPIFTHPIGSMTPSPIPNTTMDSDGVIRLTPEKGCGPYAHVENHPGYGLLCVQNEGRWDSTATLAPPCVDSHGILLTCQPESAWKAQQ
ncbi:hypothetical protein [Chromobacterium haemolyticum]|uniref:hypothetical protein n=1 Tax=Chromobacterium haemolyticum TaxID=394935 RepID=UPI00244C98FE|nr:hypothetical protein [Chromobacterium haemolyticum]MDH0341981.1 hypothetical protein [Chromobacterium haemolyticum]